MSSLVMYTGNNCSRCVQAKSIFDSQGIPYETVNVHENPDARQMLMDKQLKQLPVINNNGNWTSGFDVNVLSSILETHNLQGPAA